MNFVIFSYNFLPQADAEAYCTSRFASALARTGHKVTVVTMDHKKEISQETIDFLVDENIRVIRVPFDRCPRIISSIRHLTMCPEASNISPAIRALAKELKRSPDSILVSRCMPEVSHVISWHCRRLARTWIAHCSDIYPWIGRGKGLRDGIRYWMAMRWAKRAMRDCDAVSITCTRVKRCFLERFKGLLESKPFILTTHIGEPVLPAKSEWIRGCEDKLIVHAGGIDIDRGVDGIIKAVESLNARGVKCDFVQVGHVDIKSMPKFDDSAHCHILKSTAPDMATAVTAKADVSVIPDLDIGKEFIPFLPSKFVYQLFTDVPIVVYTLRDSEMRQYVDDYPEAGLFFADRKDFGSLPDAIEKALNVNRTQIDRSKIRERFSQERIADDFIKGVHSL